MPFNYREGSVIKYRTWSDSLRTVKVTERDPEAKDGKPGFDGVLIASTAPKDIVQGGEVWGLDSQIVEVVSF